MSEMSEGLKQTMNESYFKDLTWENLLLMLVHTCD
jgi:hypothetical protein